MGDDSRVNRINRVLTPTHAGTVSVSEAAAMLGVCAHTIRRLTRQGRFPSPIRVGSAIRFLRSAVEEWIAAGGCSGSDIQTRSAGRLLPDGLQRRYAPDRHRPTVRQQSGVSGVGMTLSGYAAVFYNPSIPGTQFELQDNVFERIDLEATRAAIQGDRDILATFNHNFDLLLGRTSSGTLRLSVDSRGLLYTVSLPDTPTGKEVAELARRGDLAGSSFTFGGVRYEDHAEGSKLIRVLKSFKLYEVGPVATPAYGGTTTGLHSASASPAADLDAIRVTLAELDAAILSD